jgi:hypothetical protein
LIAALSLAACSGPNSPGNGGGGGGGGGTGTATLSVNLIATPPAPPPLTSILSFSVDVTGLSISPVTGSAQSISLNSGTGTYVVDLTKLPSDSAFLGENTTIPSGTYSTVTVSFSAPTVTYCTQTVVGTAGCPAANIARFTGAPATPAVTTTLTLTANQKTGIALNVNLANALTVVNQAVTGVNLGASNVVTINTLPPATSSLASGQLDFVEDIFGIVTAVSGQNVTIQTGTRGSITATANQNTVFSPNCILFSFAQSIACAQVGQVASMDAGLNADGTFTLLEYDPFEKTTEDWIEGTIATVPTITTSAQFSIVINDLVIAPTNSKIGTNLKLGDTVQITAPTTATFSVDTKGLLVPAQATTFNSSGLFPGQNVAMTLTSFTAASGNTPAQATVNFVGLTFSRVSGTLVTPSSPTFSIQNLPPFFGLSGSQIVQTSLGTPPTSATTYFDGSTDATGLTSGKTVSIRALYFGPFAATPFSAAKVRLH